MQRETISCFYRQLEAKAALTVVARKFLSGQESKKVVALFLYTNEWPVRPLHFAAASISSYSL